MTIIILTTMTTIILIIIMTSTQLIIIIITTTKMMMIKNILADWECQGFMWLGHVFEMVRRSTWWKADSSSWRLKRNYCSRQTFSTQAYRQGIFTWSIEWFRRFLWNVKAITINRNASSLSARPSWCDSLGSSRLWWDFLQSILISDSSLSSLFWILCLFWTWFLFWTPLHGNQAVWD